MLNNLSYFFLAWNHFVVYWFCHSWTTNWYIIKIVMENGSTDTQNMVIYQKSKLNKTQKKRFSAFFAIYRWISISSFLSLSLIDFHFLPQFTFLYFQTQMLLQKWGCIEQKSKDSTQKHSANASKLGKALKCQSPPFRHFWDAFKSNGSELTNSRANHKNYL